MTTSSSNTAETNSAPLITTEVAPQPLIGAVFQSLRVARERAMKRAELLRIAVIVVTASAIAVALVVGPPLRNLFLILCLAAAGCLVLYFAPYLLFVRPMKLAIEGLNRYAQLSSKVTMAVPDDAAGRVARAGRELNAGNPDLARDILTEPPIAIDPVTDLRLEMIRVQVELLDGHPTPIPDWESALSRLPPAALEGAILTIGFLGAERALLAGEDPVRPLAAAERRASNTRRRWGTMV